MPAVLTFASGPRILRVWLDSYNPLEPPFLATPDLRR